MAAPKNPIKDVHKLLFQPLLANIPAFLTAGSVLTFVVVVVTFFYPHIISFATRPLLVANSSADSPASCNTTHLAPAPPENRSIAVVQLSSPTAHKRSNGSLEQGVTATAGAGKLASCDLFDGRWVVDDSRPSYRPGSCPFIDDAFNCFKNGRKDTNYTKLRWQPKGCEMPRLDGRRMLEMLRGRRLAFVGDSLNRNMWESLVCLLRSSLRNKRRVFEISGRKKFKTDGFYAFRFTDYNCTIEFFRSPFLVQEWEVLDSNNTWKETLRLDLIDKASDKYKDADVIIFNTAHWWTHEKTSQGKNYYQEGDHVYSQLNQDEAYQKGLGTWGRWIDETIDTTRSRVFFRGYSSCHFNGGQWNASGACDEETLPIMDDKYLAKYPKLISILESVIGEMKTPVLYSMSRR